MNRKKLLLIGIGVLFLIMAQVSAVPSEPRIKLVIIPFDIEDRGQIHNTTIYGWYDATF